MEVRKYLSKILLGIAVVCAIILWQILVNVKHGGLQTPEDTALNALSQKCMKNPSQCPKFQSILPNKNGECKPFPDPKNNTGQSDSVLSDILSTGLARMKNQFGKLSKRSRDPSAAIFILGNTGSGNTNSLAPEYVVCPDSGVAFWDCPGFYVSRSPKLDVATKYFLEHALNMTNSVKFLFTVSHSSVREEDEGRDFDKLVTHAVSMINNVSAMADSIGLVVTKTSASDTKSDGEITDENIISQVAKYLTAYVNRIENELNKLPSDKNMSKLQNKVSFVKGLLGESETENTNHHIFLIKSSTDCGNLGNVKFMTDESRNALIVKAEEMKYSPVTLKNFHFSLTEETISQVKTTFIPEAIQNISELIKRTFSDLESEFGQIFYKKLFENPEENMSFLNATVKTISAYNYTVMAFAPPTISSRIKELYSILPFGESSDTCIQIWNLEDQLKFLEVIIPNESHTSCPKVLWEYLLDSMLMYFKDLQDFYQFCCLANQQLAEYSKQEILSNLLVHNKHHFRQENVLSFLQENNLVEISQREQMFWHVASKVEDRKYLADLVREYIPQMKFACYKSSTNSSFHQLVVFGRILKVSDATNQTFWPKECTEENVNEMLIVAMETVYLDKDIYTKGKPLHLSIIAPEWKLHNLDAWGRLILLDGISPPELGKAVDGQNYGDDGQDGKDGIPGGDAGSFYGVYDKFENENLLHIYANGGIGRNGQNGGDGHDGKPGKDMMYVDFPSAYFIKPPDDLYKGYIDNGNLKQENMFVLVYDHLYFTKFGSRGNKGGNGGNGGNEGMPGKAGHIHIVRLKESSESRQIASSIDILNTSGTWGKPGRGGIGGKGGKTGGSLSCIKRSIMMFISFWDSCYESEKEEYAGYGSNGLMGNISVPDITSNQPRFQLWRLVNEYKKQFHGHDSKTMDEFVKKLNQDSQIANEMTPLAFGKELVSFELKFNTTCTSDISDKIYLLKPFYETFLNRLDKYSGTLDGKEMSTSETAVLNLVYTTVLGKLAGLRETGHKFEKVIKTNEYFDALTIQLEILKESRKKIIFQQESEHFKNHLHGKLQEANRFVKYSVHAAITNARIAVTELNHKLKLELQEAKENNVFKAEKAKTLYEMIMPLNIVVNFLSFGGIVCSFFGQVETVFEGILSTSAPVVKDFVPEENASQIHNFPLLFDKSFLDENILCNKKKILAIENKTGIWEKTVSELADETFDELKKMAKKRKQLFEAYKKTVENDSENKNPLPVYELELSIEQIDDELKVALKNANEKFELKSENYKENKEKVSSANFSKQSAKALEALETISDFGMNTLKAVGNLHEFDKVAMKSRDNVNKVKAKRFQFMDEFLPQLGEIYNFVKRKTSEIPGESQVAVKQLKVKGMLKKMRVYIRGFNAGMQITEEFQLAFDTLEEALTLMIDLYEHIEHYEEKKQLADYSAKITAAESFLSEVTDDELLGVLSRLNFYIESSLFMEEYLYALHAFKQWVFPFASHYLNDRKIRNTTATAVNTDQVLGFYMKEVEFLRLELAKYKATTVTGDKYLVRHIFTSDAVSSEPFYIWKNRQWQVSIKKLLNGEQVQLLADVDMRDHPGADFFRKKSAIKYKTIELSLKVKDESRQQELMEKLKHFHLNMTHSGVSLYKVMGQNYVMFDSSQSYRYSFERIGSNRHVSVGTVKYKVDGPEVDFLMSPYTWWTFQLIDVKPGGIGFSDLQEFFDEVDLHMEGEGIYLDEEYTPENILNELNLHQHYELYDPEGYAVNQQNSNENLTT